MSDQTPRTVVTERGDGMSLEMQAREIVRTLLADTSPDTAPARNRLHCLLAVHPGDYVAVLREHLILTRGLTRTSPPRKATTLDCG